MRWMSPQGLPAGHVKIRSLQFQGGQTLDGLHLRSEPLVVNRCVLDPDILQLLTCLAGSDQVRPNLLIAIHCYLLLTSEYPIEIELNPGIEPRSKAVPHTRANSPCVGQSIRVPIVPSPGFDSASLTLAISKPLASSLDDRTQ